MDQLSNSNSKNCSENNEEIDDLADFPPSSTNLLYETESEVVCLSAEDIASGALARIFDEDFDDPCVSTDDCTIPKQVRHFNDNFETSTDQKHAKAIPLRSQKMEYHTCIPSVFGQNSPKLKQKSIMNRRLSPHPPHSRQGGFNMNNTSSLRKTKSTALPAILTTPWRRGETASTPDLKMHHQGILTDSPEEGDVGPRHRRICRQRVISYYNLRLLGVILNCVILVAGLVHLGGAAALTIYRDIVLIIVKYEMYVIIGASLAMVAIMLLILSITGLSLVHDSPRKISTHAGCCLIMAAVMVSLASLENSAEGTIQSDAKSHMLSTIQPQEPHIAWPAWNKFHYAFKCCGVKGPWDWCYKETDDRKRNESIEQNFLGIYVCMVPLSCCTEHLSEHVELTMPDKFSPTLPCSQTRTMSYTYRFGCLTPLKFEIHYLGKVYRIISFCTVIALILSAVSSMFLYTYV